MTYFIRDRAGAVPSTTGEFGERVSAAGGQVFAVYRDPGGGSSTEAISIMTSAPWWAGRIVGPAERGYTIVREPEPAAFGVEMVPFQERELRAAPHHGRLELDFGEGVTVADRAMVGSGEIHVVTTNFLYGFFPVVDTPEGDYLAPDSSEELAAASVADDSEWSDDDNGGPSWIALADLPYRGGGVMARLRPRGRSA